MFLVVLAWLTAFGAAVSFGGALWLVFAADPDDPRFERGGPTYLGKHQTTPVPDLIRLQRRPAIVIAIGTGFQLLIALGAVIAQISARR